MIYGLPDSGHEACLGLPVGVGGAMLGLPQGTGLARTEDLYADSGCVWDTLPTDTWITFLDSKHLSYKNTNTSYWHGRRGTCIIEGRKYFELTSPNSPIRFSCCIVNATTTLYGTASRAYIPAKAWEWAYRVINTDGYIINESGGGQKIVGGGTVANGVIQCAIDRDEGQIWWGHDNTWILGGDPANGKNPSVTFDANNAPDLYPGSASYNNSTYSVMGMFDSKNLVYDPPDGFGTI